MAPDIRGKHWLDTSCFIDAGWIFRVILRHPASERLKWRCMSSSDSDSSDDFSAQSLWEVCLDFKICISNNTTCLCWYLSLTLLHYYYGLLIGVIVCSSYTQIYLATI